MSTLVDKIHEEFGDDIREIVEEPCHFIVLREPLEDIDPRDEGEDDEDLIEMYDNCEVYDITIYDKRSEEVIDASGQLFGRDYALEYAQDVIECVNG